MSLEGKVIIVTGAASGIGRALSEGFYADGAKVVGFDFNKGGLEETKSMCGLKMLAITGDVCIERDVDNLVGTVMEEYGRIDVLFNNAGISDKGPFTESPFDQWAMVILVNLVGPALCAHRILPSMLKQGSGRIINVVSRGAEAVAGRNPGYSASKAGLVSFTKNTASSIDRQKYPDVLINGLIPGITDTAIWGNAPIPEERRKEFQPPEAVYPFAKALVELPAGGPTGRIFYQGQDYPIFSRFNG